MKRHRTTGMLLFCLLAAGRPLAAQKAGPEAAGQVAGVPAAAAGADIAPLFRVFLKDGTSLVSYGEMARVEDRVVFSMPTSPSDAAPQLQLINIPSETVDWPSTLNYAESV